MSSTATVAATKTEITLKGSVEIVTEFFGFCINSILYQRGIYAPETFTSTPKYGLSLLTTTDESLRTYLANVLRQLASWLSHGQVQKLVVVITGVETHEVLERWVFNIETDKSALAPGTVRIKNHREIQSEIQAIIRQITASITFLPLLEEPCTFDLLVYTDEATAVPKAWEESDPRYIAESAEVKLRSFTTTIHKVAPTVSYRVSASGEV